ncbi:MAG: hypothetical protein JXJ04_03025 [Spirochaetales bacterium]|nr:hypothetical protein [Spirochaetales bacterium]
MPYDYSKLPEHSWCWEYEKRDYMEAISKPIGLVYKGELCRGPYAGPYTGGFQSWNKLEINGPLYKMPGVFLNELYQHLKKYRRKNGSRLIIKLINKAGPLYIAETGYKLNTINIHSSHERSKETEQTDIIFDGPCPKKAYRLNFAIYLNDPINEKKVTRIYAAFSFKIFKTKQTIRINIRKNKELTIGAVNGREIIPMSKVEIYSGL